MNCPVHMTGSDQIVSACVVTLCAMLSPQAWFQSRECQIVQSLVALGFESIIVSTRILKLKTNQTTPKQNQIRNEKQSLTMREGCTELLQFVLVPFPLHECVLRSLSSSIGVVSTHGDTPIEKHAAFVAQMCLFPAQRAKQSSSLCFSGSESLLTSSRAYSLTSSIPT